MLYQPSIVNVCMSADSIVYLKSDGTVWAKGPNTNGRFNATSVTSHDTFTKVPFIDNVRAIRMIFGGMYYIKNDGSAYYSGFAAKSPYTAKYSDNIVNTPTKVPLNNVADVLGDDNRFKAVLFITEEGEVYQNGYSVDPSNGVAIRTAINSTTGPIKCPGLHDIKQFQLNRTTGGSTTYYYPVFLTNNGEIFAERVDSLHGKTDFTFLTDSTRRHGVYIISTQTQVKKITLFSDSTSSKVGFMLKNNGTLYSYAASGRNAAYGNGVNATGDKKFSSISTDVKDFTAGHISANQYLFIIKNNGDVYAHGINTNGIIGTNTTTTVAALTKVNDNCEAVVINEGTHAIFLKKKEVPIQL